MNQREVPPRPSLPPRPRPSNFDPPAYAFPGIGVDPPSPSTSPFLPRPWDDPQSVPRPRVQSANQSLYHRPEISRFPSDAPIVFPEPQLLQPSISDSSHLCLPSRNLNHRHSRSDFRPQTRGSIPPRHRGPNTSPGSAPSHQQPGNSQHHPENVEKPSSSIPNANSDDILQRFQSGTLRDEDQEWHRLVPEEAQEALGKREVHRQSVIFEIIKGERDYVSDLELVQQLFIDGLHTASTRVIDEINLPKFVRNVFGNLDEILIFHRRLLSALFARQREQHPLLQSVADVILDTTIRAEFRAAYETYIKHYPLAESYHRRELKRNRLYEQYVQSISNDSRVRKRDLITFLSRPVTRLPRLNLLLEQSLKSTEKDFEHPDLETLPIILGILNDCIKSTQPGIEAAENKVKFWALCESLVYQKGEIIDMDLYDNSRTLIHSSSAARKVRTETGFHEWNDLVVSLLDNYFLLTRVEKQTNRPTVKRYLTSRPIHLSFLRLGSFADAPDTRKERHEGGLLDSLWSQSVPVFPFTIYHASSRSTRRYTLYVASEAQRQKWRITLSEAISVHRVREDSNKWFDPQDMSNKFFRVPSSVTPSALEVTGKFTSAVPFCFAGRKFLAAGCSKGIFISIAGNENFRKVLHHSNPKYIAALETLGNKIFNRFIVHSESALVSYSLDLLARFALNQTTSEAVEASVEMLHKGDPNIIFCKCLQMCERAMVIYASKRRLSTTLTIHVMEAIAQSEREANKRVTNNAPVSFQPCGEPGFVPRDAYSVDALTKKIAICTQDGIVIADPINFARSEVMVIPDLRDAVHNLSMSILKERISGAKPLGLVRVDASELLVIYDLIGCYITKQGVPSRSCGCIRWEAPASGFAHRGNHVLLVSTQFIEVRNITTGRIAQVIEGTDIRLMYNGHSTSDKDDRVLVAMRGDKRDGDGTFTDRLVELVETVEYVPQTPASAVPPVDVWAEWDM
ncbi:hypothetical protein P691DRAFT_734916, partial [Macrolepiota fuliginosa MF-IS2]